MECSCKPTMARSAAQPKDKLASTNCLAPYSSLDVGTRLMHAEDRSFLRAGLLADHLMLRHAVRRECATADGAGYERPIGVAFSDDLQVARELAMPASARCFRRPQLRLRSHHASRNEVASGRSRGTAAASWAVKAFSNNEVPCGRSRRAAAADWRTIKALAQDVALARWLAACFPGCRALEDVRVHLELRHPLVAVGALETLHPHLLLATLAVVRQ